MPELPEVEIIVQCLNKLVSGRKIETADLRRKLLAPDTSRRSFASRLKNSTINFVHRRGKHILFDLDNSRTLLTHLRMSGRFMLLNGDEADPKFAHAVFHFDDERLVFQDQRHFGLMKVIDTRYLARDPSISKLAPEPFSDAFSTEYLQRSLKASNRSLKEFLLDQTKVCGLGNIYASEAMFRSRLSPRRRSRNVARSRTEALHQSILDVLNEAIEFNSMRIPDSVIIGEGVYGDGVDGDWNVYDREGKPCLVCSASIRRIRQGQRSTYYCPKCQR